jgi:predicted RNA binding protein YcfA (HicA-like mRNA interferase family)
MSEWPSTKAQRVLAALLRSGWAVKRQTGSRHVLTKADWPEYVFAFHEGEDIGPGTLSRIAKHTGLRPDDL